MVHTGLLQYCIKCTIHTKKRKKKKALSAEAQLLVMLLAGTGFIWHYVVTFRVSDQ